MVYLAIWLSVVLAGLMIYWARRQARLNTELAKRLSEQEARADKLAGFVQRAMEDTYVLSMVMTERGHIDSEALERGRERLIKRVTQNQTEAKPEPQPQDAQRSRILH